MSSLNLIFSQRLVRQLCPSCKVARMPTEIEKKLLPNIGDREIFEPKGCNNCMESGFKGRIGIFEFLPIYEPIRDLISQNGLTESLITTREQILRTLVDSGLHKISEGITSFSELERVCGPCR